MPFPALPNILATDEVVCIRNTWGQGPGGARAVTSQAVVGRFRCLVEPDPEPLPEDGYSGAFQRPVNVDRWLVTFVAPHVPAGGLKPRDTVLWADAARVGHVAHVTLYWAGDAGSGTFHARATEKT